MPNFYKLRHTLYTGPKVRNYLGEDFDKIGIPQKKHIKPLESNFFSQIWRAIDTHQKMGIEGL
jgi:hypothetical protein